MDSFNRIMRDLLDTNNKAKDDVKAAKDKQLLFKYIYVVI